MTIKNKLRLSISFIIGLIISIGVIFYVTEQRLINNIKTHSIADKIVKTTTFRNGLVIDYLRFHTERAKKQWQLEQDAVINLIQSNVLNISDKQVTINQIKKTNTEINLLFAHIVTNAEEPKSNSITPAFTQEIEDRLVSQILLKMQANISRAYELSETSMTAINTAQKLINVLLLMCISLLVLFVAILFVYFKKLIIRPLSALHKSTEVIANGNLDYRVDINSHDEFGQVARSFNEMTIKLKESYSGLEQAVQRRTEELNKRIEEVERMNKLMIGRELKMVELKKKIEVLQQAQR